MPKSQTKETVVETTSVSDADTSITDTSEAALESAVNEILQSSDGSGAEPSVVQTDDGNLEVEPSPKKKSAARSRIDEADEASATDFDYVSEDEDSDVPDDDADEESEEEDSDSDTSEQQPEGDDADDDGETVTEEESSDGKDVPAFAFDESLTKPLELDLDPNDFDPAFLDKVVKPLVDQVNQMKEALKSSQEVVRQVHQQRQQEAVAELRRQIDPVFDQAGSDIPELGNSSKLDKGALAARVRLCTVADGIRMGWNKANPKQPMSPADAIRKAIEINYGKKQTESGLVNKLVKNQQRLTARPSHRKTVAKFKNAEEEATAKVNDYLSQAGISLSS